MDQSRRKILKFIAAAPLTLTFGFAGEALLRFAKPSMKPGGVFDAADRPTFEREVYFYPFDFPEPWTAIPFMFPMKVALFSPQKYEIRKIPGYIVALPNGTFAAYSRVCPARGCGYLNFVPNPMNYHCGCVPKSQHCCCASDVPNPVLVCPCDGSTFDLAQEGRIVQGPAPRPPYRFEVQHIGDKITILDVEHGIV